METLSPFTRFYLFQGSLYSFAVTECLSWNELSDFSKMRLDDYGSTKIEAQHVGLKSCQTKRPRDGAMLSRGVADDGVRESIDHALPMAVRDAEERQASPCAGPIDKPIGRDHGKQVTKGL